MTMSNWFDFLYQTLLYVKTDSKKIVANSAVVYYYCVWYVFYESVFTLLLNLPDADVPPPEGGGGGGGPGPGGGGGGAGAGGGGGPDEGGGRGALPLGRLGGGGAPGLGLVLRIVVTLFC